MKHSPDFTKKIGYGTCGFVYRSKEEPDEVAIKVIDIIKNDMIIDKYTDEFLSLTRNNKYLTHLYEIYKIDSDFCYVSMEYLSGMDLLDYILDFGSLAEPIVEDKVLSNKSNKFVKNIIKEVLEALNYLHQNKIIHCDVKNENIRLLNDGHIKLFDYHLYCYDDNNKRNARGTFGYIAPEILLNRDKETGLVNYDTKVDIWSLGQSLYILMEYQMMISTNQKIYYRKICDMKDKKTFVDMLDRKIWDDNLIDVFDAMVRIDPKARKSAKEILEILVVV